MRYKAVIFDLFGTLVYSFSFREHESMLSEMAKVLSVPRDDFARMWVETFPERAIGLFAAIEANIEHICQVLGYPVNDTKIKTASDIRLRFVKRTLTPHPGALETLAQLKARGYKIGVITDASAELPNLWPDTPFAPLVDVVVFSCKVGVKKPDSRIYMLACGQLGIAPQDCLYVGDGDSRELTGAAAVGMQPLLFRATYEGTYDTYHMDSDADEWTGPTISTLKEILALV